MIKMVDKQEIIFMYRREGRSIRDISKALNHHRATVAKVIREYESSIRSDNPSQALTEALVTEPSYHGKHRPVESRARSPR